VLDSLYQIHDSEKHPSICVLYSGCSAVKIRPFTSTTTMTCRTCRTRYFAIRSQIACRTEPWYNEQHDVLLADLIPFPCTKRKIIWQRENNSYEKRKCVGKKWKTWLYIKSTRWKHQAICQQGQKQKLQYTAGSIQKCNFILAITLSDVNRSLKKFNVGKRTKFPTKCV